MTKGIKGGQKSSSVDLDSFKSKHGVLFRKGDCVLMKSHDEQKPFIGRIVQIARTPSEGVQCKVTWFYRPEECEGGRQVFHGERELLSSQHTDWVSEDTFISKCRVLSLEDYQQLQTADEGTDFFTRIEYRPHTRDFKPDRVEIYCLCEMPYNPDNFMAECSSCKEWFHPACVAQSEQQMAQADWTCPTCLSTNHSTQSVVRVAHSFVPTAASLLGHGVRSQPMHAQRFHEPGYR